MHQVLKTTHPATTSTFGERLRGLREERGLSQRALGEALEYTGKSIYNWETGASTPGEAALAPLAKALGCTVDDLLGRSNDPRP